MRGGVVIAVGEDRAFRTSSVPAVPRNDFAFGKVRLNRKKGTATLQVKTPGPGRVLLAGSKMVVKSSAIARAGATVKLKVNARGKAAKRLSRKGKVKVMVIVKFTPIGGKARIKSKSLKLVLVKNQR